MKTVSGNVFVATIVIAILAVGGAFLAGMATFKSQHGCVVDPETKKATCTK